MAKKVSKKKTVKRKTVTQSHQPPLNEDWVEKVPKAVQDRVDDYVAAMRAKNKANEEWRHAKQECIEAMQEAGIHAVRLPDEDKILRVSDEPKLKTEKTKKPEEA